MYLVFTATKQEKEEKRIGKEGEYLSMLRPFLSPVKPDAAKEVSVCGE